MENKKIRQDIEENVSSEFEEYEDIPDNILEKIEWFKDQKLGVIFHWGLYSIPGIVESWQLSKEDNWARKTPFRNNLTELREDYFGLSNFFNPYKFDARNWAEICKKNGFKYMIFTTKHHDGFNMFNTKYSDYKITSNDFFKQIADAFREVGISVGAYYSKADWHSPLYWEPNSDPIGRYASYNPLEKVDKWRAYNSFVENQLIELSSFYGDLDILWLDAGWVNKQNEQLDMDGIVQSVRTQQPDILVVDRTIGGKYENYVTPERKIPDVLPKKAWESNIPIAKNWGFCPNDIYKTPEELIENLVKIVAKGGNLLLGVGPKPNGDFSTDVVEILNSIGKWMEKYNEAIYNTRPVEINLKTDWLLTCNDNTIYLFGHNSFEDDFNLRALEKELNTKILEIYNLTTKQIIDPDNDNLTVNTKEIFEVYRILTEEGNK